MSGRFPDMAPPAQPSWQTAKSRQAALMLHAMEPADRAWILEQLPRTERVALQSLLAELEALGIPPDRDCLDGLAGLREASPSTQPAVEAVVAPGSVLANGHGEPAPDEHVPDGDALMSLDTEKSARLAQAWRAQPALLVAQALSLRPWPWRAALLEQLPALQRRRVMNLLGSPGGCGRPAPALAAGLLRCMRQCCDAPPPPSAVSLPAGGCSDAAAARRWHRWLPRPLRMGKRT